MAELPNPPATLENPSLDEWLQNLARYINDLYVRKDGEDKLLLTDGITAPGTTTGKATIYVDTADGDLKIRFADDTVKTIVVDT